MDRILTRILSLYPDAPVVAVADGAEENWRILGKYSQKPIMDFYHAAGYRLGCGPCDGKECRAARILDCIGVSPAQTRPAGCC
jgi:hypothetical protein